MTNVTTTQLAVVVMSFEDSYRKVCVQFDKIRNLPMTNQEIAQASNVIGGLYSNAKVLEGLGLIQKVLRHSSILDNMLRILETKAEQNDLDLKMKESALKNNNITVG